MIWLSMATMQSARRARVCWCTQAQAPPHGKCTQSLYGHATPLIRAYNMNNVSLARVNSIMAIGNVKGVHVCVCVVWYVCGVCMCVVCLCEDEVIKTLTSIFCSAREKGICLPPGVQLDAFVREGWLD